MATLTFGSGNFASLTEGAIVGDTPAPFCSLKLLAGATLTTGVLNAGDTGELGGLSTAAVEFWVRISALPAALHKLIIGPETAVAGNRQWGFEVNTTGTVRFYVRNTTPTLYLITSATALTPGAGSGQWYHVVGVYDTNILRLYINGAQEATTITTGAIVASAFGANGDMSVGHSGAAEDMSFDEIATYRKSLAASRVSAHYQAGTQTGFRTQVTDIGGVTSYPKSGSRVIDVLDASQSRAAPRSVMTGTRSVTEAYMVGQAPLDELARARSAENVDAMLFTSKSGVITFLDASHRSSSPYNSVQQVFGDAGGTELPYEDTAIDYSDTFLVNQWNVTRSIGRRPDLGGGKGEVQTAQDTTSITTYFERPQTMTDVPVINDSDASDIATAMLAKYKDPMLRFGTIEVNTLDPNVAFNCLRLELGDKVQVLRTPPGGGARIDQSYWIQKIEITGANDSNPWIIRFGVSPL